MEFDRVFDEIQSSQYLAPAGRDISDFENKMRNVPKDQQLKLLWMWIKQNLLSYKEFEALLKYVYLEY